MKFEEKKLILEDGKKCYFSSDIHLGSPSNKVSKIRELKVVNWLEDIKSDAGVLFLLGDIFDFWFEYKQVIPKGYTRFLGKIAEFTDSGIPVYFFTGNHDMWMFDYFEEELNVQVIKNPVSFNINGKKFLIGHGDGLGPGDRFYKFLKIFFNSKLCYKSFSLLHPYIGMSIATNWSRASRRSGDKKEDPFLEEKEWLIQYCSELEKSKHHDYYIFGHRHKKIRYNLNQNSEYINIGDWFKSCPYAIFDGNSVSVEEC